MLTSTQCPWNEPYLQTHASCSLLAASKQQKWYVDTIYSALRRVSVSFLRLVLRVTPQEAYRCLYLSLSLSSPGLQYLLRSKCVLEPRIYELSNRYGGVKHAQEYINALLFLVWGQPTNLHLLSLSLSLSSPGLQYVLRSKCVLEPRIYELSNRYGGVKHAQETCTFRILKVGFASNAVRGGTLTTDLTAPPINFFQLSEIT